MFLCLNLIKCTKVGHVWYVTIFRHRCHVPYVTYAAVYCLLSTVLALPGRRDNDHAAHLIMASTEVGIFARFGEFERELLVLIEPTGIKEAGGALRRARGNGIADGILIGPDNRCPHGYFNTRWCKHKRFDRQTNTDFCRCRRR